LVRIGRIQLVLLPLGTAAWLLRSGGSARVFAAGGLASIGFWYLHRLIVVRMLTPSVRHRWFYGALTVLKLALIVLILRGMMGSFPLERIPLVTGILLFNASILVEAIWLMLHPAAPSST
jgi:hypothetical protein